MTLAGLPKGGSVFYFVKEKKMKSQILGKLQGHIILSIILSLVLLTVSHADTNVSGNITTETTWTLTNSPYIVTGTIQVLEGATLTIEPGVIVKFSKNTLLRIGGELIADGTETQMLTFTSNEPAPSAGDWGPIEFVEDAVGSTLDEDGKYISGSIIKYCWIEYGKGVNAGVELYIEENIIKNALGYGIFLRQEILVYLKIQ